MHNENVIGVTNWRCSQGLALELAVPLLCTVPGHFVLGLIPHSDTLPFGSALAISTVLSSLLICLIYIPGVRRYSGVLSKGFCFMTLVGGFVLLAGPSALIAFGRPAQLAFLALPVLSYGIWAIFSRRSLYPGEPELSLGDTVAYYRIADNLLSQGRFIEDYQIGDYYGGTYGYMSSLPVSATLIAFFRRLFGPNGRSLALYNAWCGAVACLVFAELAADGEISRLALAIGFLCIPAIWAHFSVGAHTISGLMGALLVGVLTQVDLNPVTATLFWVPCLAYLALLRPEGQLWLLMLAAITGLAYAKPLGLAVVLVGLLAAWTALPFLFVRLRKTLFTMAIFHLYYDVDSGLFNLAYSHWSLLNKDFSCWNARNSWPDSAEQGRVVGASIRAHPVAFIQHLLRMAGLTANIFVKGLYEANAKEVAKTRFGHTLIAVIVSYLALLAQGMQVLVASALAYLVILPLVNEGRGIRHVLLLLPIILAAAWRTLSTLGIMAPDYVAGFEIPWLLCALAGLSVIGSLWLRRLRKHTSQAALAKAAECFRRFIPPGSTVCCTSPQLFAYLLNCTCSGSTFLAHFIEYNLSQQRFDYVIVDDLRGGRGAYSTLKERFCLLLPGYRLLAQDEQNKWALYQSGEAKAATASIPVARQLPTELSNSVGQSMILSALKPTVARRSGHNWRATFATLGFKTAPAAYHATQRGNLLAVKSYLQRGGKVDSTNHSLRSLLMVAAEHGHVQLVTLLLKHGADPNHTDIYWITPVMTAARNNQVPALKLLLAAGAIPKGRNRFGHSALSWAVKWNQREAAFLLLEHGACVFEEDIDGVSPIEWAYRHNEWELLGALIRCRVWDNSSALSHILHLAVRDGNVPVLRACMSNLYDKSGKGPMGLTPMHLAAHFDNVETLQLCWELGAPLDPEDCFGATPLMYAARQGSKNAVEMLLGTGADMLHRDAFGNTASQWAQQSDRDELRPLLQGNLTDSAECKDIGRAVNN